MPLSQRDKSNVSINALIGYSLSAFAVINSPKPERKRWAEGIVEIANSLSEKLDKKEGITP